MTKAYPGFPHDFPVRGDNRLPLRFLAMRAILRAGFTAILGGGLDIQGTENLVEEGPLLVVANHLSNIDPLLFGAYWPGNLYAMGKRELFRGRAWTWVLAGCNSFPVDRGAPDRWSLRIALDLLARRRRLLLFIEGTRGEGAPGMRRAEPGVGFLVRRSGADIQPVAIWGTERVLTRGRLLPRRAPVHIRYGRVVRRAELGEGDAQAVADRVGERIAALLPAAYRGVYARPATPPGGPSVGGEGESLA